MLPLLINAGQRLFAGELGVRIGDVVIMGLALLLLFRLLQKNGALQKHLYLIILSLPLFNYISIIVFPDTPLVALSMLYLYFYKRFLEKDDGISAFILGITLSAMLYSKYHAVLMPLFIIISNIGLLRNKKYLGSLCLAAALYFPHIYWQYLHDFISFKYHLLGRSSGFSIESFTEYPSVQFLVLGPALIFTPFVIKAKDRFERALKFIVIGTLSFFLVATLKGYVHFHWTSIVLFPLIILSYTYYSKRSKKWLLYLSIPLLLFVFFLRSYLAVKILPVNTFNRVDYFHGRQTWADDITRIAGNKPVVFENQLREAPLYAFYSGKQSVAMYGGESKKTQYQLWNEEDNVQGKDVLVIKDGECNHCTRLVTRMGKEIRYLPVARFASYQNVLISLKAMTKQTDSTVRIIFEMLNYRNSSLMFATNAYGNQPTVVLKAYGDPGKKDTVFTLQALSEKNVIEPHSSRVFSDKISPKCLNRFSRWYSFGIDDGVFGASTNSKRYEW
jgi:hypothetical protein